MTSPPLAQNKWPLIINITQISACCFPVFLYVADLFDYSTNFLLSAFLVFMASLVTAYIWARVIEQIGVLSKNVSSLKSRNLRDAREICFSRLWIIPSKTPLPVSDAALTLATKAYGLTVRGVVAARPDIGFLTIGFICLFSFYIGFTADFGIALSRIETAFQATKTIQLFFISFTSIICSVLLFNGFFQFFISQCKDKK